jgi:hypothetical protein
MRGCSQMCDADSISDDSVRSEAGLKWEENFRKSNDLRSLRSVVYCTWDQTDFSDKKTIHIKEVCPVSKSDWKMRGEVSGSLLRSVANGKKGWREGRKDKDRWAMTIICARGWGGVHMGHTRPVGLKWNMGAGDKECQHTRSTVWETAAQTHSQGNISTGLQFKKRQIRHWKTTVQVHSLANFRRSQTLQQTSVQVFSLTNI